MKVRHARCASLRRVQPLRGACVQRGPPEIPTHIPVPDVALHLRFAGAETKSQKKVLQRAVVSVIFLKIRLSALCYKRFEFSPLANLIDTPIPDLQLKCSYSGQR